jgi:hypothetical protein
MRFLGLHKQKLKYRLGLLEAKTEIPGTMVLLSRSKRKFVMKSSVALPTAAALLLCSASFAQNSTSQVSKSVKPQIETARVTAEDGDKEEKSRELVLQKMRREYSDASGRVRPDLWQQGVAQMKRMKVVSQIGPVPKESPEKK